MSGVVFGRSTEARVQWLVCILLWMDEVFFKILKKPFIVQKKMIPHMKAKVIFIGKKQKQFFFEKPNKQKQKNKTKCFFSRPF